MVPNTIDAADHPVPPGRPRRRWLRRLLVAAGCVLLLLSALGGYLWYEASTVLDELRSGAKRPAVVAAERELEKAPRFDLEALLATPPVPAAPPVAPAAPVPTPPPAAATTPDPAESRPVTILLIGSDRRWNETGGRSDTIILARLDPAAGAAALLSIPRDLLVEIPGRGTGKINESFAAGGPALLIATLRDALGVRIDHFVEVNFGGFSRLVTALGGVYLPVDQRYFNRHDGTAARNYAEIDLQPGYQRLNGESALQFARFRHADSDFFRAARQQIVIGAMVRQLLASKYDFLRMRGVIHAFARASASDIAAISDLWELLGALRRVSPERISRQVLPAEGSLIGGVYTLRSTAEKQRAALERWLHPGTRERRPTPRAERTEAPKPPPPIAVDDDGGRGRAALTAVPSRLDRCFPTLLPRGYRYAPEPPRAYDLAGHAAIALVLTAGSGRSALLMQTSWRSPPALAEPTATVRQGDRTLLLWTEAGAVRQVAWRVGSTTAWLTNTLGNELSRRQMLAVAGGCVVDA